ncbi:sodium- and chloride-dependent transporter XTRP3 [Lates japonicus]|uniref:Sodium- and chloride-dependent transporter XTRP3 n=1 Tax=Lates japonicus TaxID=270547 RepID=A0AAD3ND39_LATJO|nr:sodium- and chloride-dependent transporter XTRP3 [Lates japonicus]
MSSASAWHKPSSPSTSDRNVHATSRRYRHASCLFRLGVKILTRHVIDRRRPTVYLAGAVQPLNTATSNFDAVKPAPAETGRDANMIGVSWQERHRRQQNSPPANITRQLCQSNTITGKWRIINYIKGGTPTYQAWNKELGKSVVTEYPVFGQVFIGLLLVSSVSCVPLTALYVYCRKRKRGSHHKRQRTVSTISA